MAVALTLKWPGATKEQYDKLLELVDWEAEPASGGIFHVAWFDEDGMGIVDVWESPQDWQRFMDERLAPELATVGAEGQPEVEFHEVHRYFNTESAHAAA